MKWTAALLLASIVFLCPVAGAQSPALVEQADAIIRDWFDSADVPGVAVSIGARGEMVYSRGFGYADLEHRVPVDPITTKFRIASMSKPLASAALGLLIDRGVIDIDAAVQRYLPDFPEHSQGQISATQLAGHLGGIRHVSSQDEAFSHEHFTGVMHALSVFKDYPLIHVPGEAYYYSNYGFTLLSALIEAAAGRDFLEFMNNEVFQPFGMENTVADNIYDIIPNRAASYEADASSTFVNARLADHSATWAAGGLAISYAPELQWV